jgi:radical SAM enzyme (TIGR01210 family)
MIESPFPADDHWIREQRGTGLASSAQLIREALDPWKPYAILSERERTAEGRIETVNTVFLTNRECRFTCLMCDLWKNTTRSRVPAGAIPAQIRRALDQLPRARHIKLYNSGNFFDPGAIPPEDYPAIAELLKDYHTLTVENHPLLTGESCLAFARMLAPRLTVAMGLETVHPEVLEKLNKKMRVEDFSRAVAFLREHRIGTRAFILLRPPYLNEEEGVEWAMKSLDFALDSGTEVCTVIPTRAGNGAMERLQEAGLFSPPSLRSLEKVLEYGIQACRARGSGRVFADTWDLALFSDCPECTEARSRRIEEMNLRQALLPALSCRICS